MGYAVPASPSPYGPEAHEREQRLLWPRRWLVVGRVDELPEPAHYFTWGRTEVPLLILRSSDGEVRGFYNSCRHRGAPVVREARGRNRALRCQYHSWTYDTLGRLVSVPDERDFVDLRLEERSLVPIEVATAGSWIFAAQPGVKSSPPADFPNGTDGLRTIRSLSVSAECDWKVAAGRVAEIATGFTRTVGAAVQPNGHVSASADAGVGFFAWPTGAATCEIQAIISAPDWGEEDSPADSAEWQGRFAEILSLLERAALEATAEQAAIDRNGIDAASAETRAVCELVEQLLGGG